MVNTEPDKKAAIGAVTEATPADRGESVGLMEPLVVGEGAREHTALSDLAVELAAAAAHHRLVWIHPFLDGNGRVARLMSHAMLLEALDTGGVWSIARGLARDKSRYRQLLMACDLTCRNDLDGRGMLSEEALAEFTAFFLTTCINQVVFMEELVQPDRLRNRILIWAEEEILAAALPPKSGAVLEGVLYRGALPRGEVAGLLGVSERHARRISAACWSRRARGRPCVLPSRQSWPRGGCRVCSPSNARDHPWNWVAAGRQLLIRKIDPP